MLSVTEPLTELPAWEALKDHHDKTKHTPAKRGEK